MIRLVTSAAALALTAAAFTPSAAQAADPPVYTCETLHGDPATTVLTGGCAASPGAVTNGDFTGEVIGQTRQFPIRIRCTGGGRADVPDQVLMMDCVQIG
ncbi:hypothetical protein GCM10022419_123010 [Nonomuraea rosea]|uniref:Secreted protein n=1 Tax=Nonomuraea rosea TaxID=638574 RepID=A0ABP6ZQC0_9ACTN